MAEQILAERTYPVVNKRAFVYMFDEATQAQIEVGQFENWGVVDSMNTMEYRESGYLTPLLIPLDFSFTGSLSKGKLNHILIKQLWKSDSSDKVDLTSEKGYWIPKKSKLKIVKQFSDNATEEVTVYNNIIFFNHRENNARGLVEESVSWMAESMESYTQPLVEDR